VLDIQYLGAVSRYEVEVNVAGGKVVSMVLPNDDAQAAPAVSIGSALTIGWPQHAMHPLAG